MGFRRALFFLIFFVIGSCVVSAVEDVPGRNNDEEYTTESLLISFIIAFLKFVFVLLIFGAIFVSFVFSLYHLSIKPWLDYGVDEVHHAQLGIVEEFVEFDEQQNEL